MENKIETAVFGGGCFWCTEAIFEELRGVVSVKSGYAGGHVKNPTYEQVSTGTTGHAEVIQITFNSEEITFNNLLTVFFASHDLTTPNRQGADIGPQYRSIVLYTNEQQKQEAEEFIKKLNASSTEGTPITTEIKPLEEFYEAEKEHQDFYKNNPSQTYCVLVINPKLAKVQKEFSQLLKLHAKN